MFVKEKASGDLVEVIDITALVDPFQNKISGCVHAGEEMQDSRYFPKSGLIFPSGETLPRCWTDAHYRG